MKHQKNSKLLYMFNNEPFGSVNAGTRDDISSSYVDIRKLLPSKYLSISDLTKARIIVGKKGSGKTHLLRHMEGLFRKNNIHAEYIALDKDVFLGKGVRSYRGDLTAEESTILWSEIWRISLVVAALSIFTCTITPKRARKAIHDAEGEVYVDDKNDPIASFKNSIEENYPEINWKFKRPATPFFVLQTIIGKYTNLRSFRNDLLSKLNLDELEDDVSILLNRYGSVHFLVDGLDELAWSDPAGWLDIQRGLFKCVFLFSAVTRYTQSLKLTVAIRSYVYSRSSQDPHIDRARGHVLHLNWDADAALKFMKERLRSLVGGNFYRSEFVGGENPLVDWLEIGEIEVGQRSSKECVNQYLLRHTRLSPRNIVDVLNRLAKHQNECAASGQSVTEASFKSLIADVAREVGKSLLMTASEELIAGTTHFQVSRDAVFQGQQVYSDFLISEVADLFESLISSNCKEIMSVKEFDRVVRLFFQATTEDPKSKKTTNAIKEIKAVLWRSSLVAYQRNDAINKKWRYSWAEGEFGFDIPHKSADQIGFHASMIDLCGLKVMSNEPIF